MLRRRGFSEQQARRDVRSFAAHPTPFLTYSVHLYEDGTALFSWEFAIAAYAATRGFQVGSDEHLNTFMYPKADVRGPQDPAWLTAQLDGTKAVLDSMSFSGADPVEPDDSDPVGPSGGHVR